MKKKSKRPYTNSQVYHLAHRLGLPGNTAHREIGYEVMKHFGYQCGWRKSLEKYFTEKPLITGIEPYKKSVSTFVYKTPCSVNTNEFLLSYEWRKIRLVALKLHGKKCLCCGATPESGAILNVDHIKPRKTHPELALDIDNLQVLCNECNHGKGNWDETDFRT